MRRRDALAALVLLAAACGGKGDERPARVVDPELLPRYAACQSGCDQVLLEELRALVRARPEVALFRYKAGGSARKQVDAILSGGWRHRDRPFRVEPPIDWNADPFDERHWRFQLNAMPFIVPFLGLHAETGDPAPLRFARAVFLDWIDFNLVRNRTNEFRWYDHATGLRAAYLAYVLDRSLRADELTAADLALLLRAARDHVHKLGDRDLLATNNHALFQLVGLAGLCKAVPALDGCAAAPAYAAREFERIVESQFTTDAIHAENSPWYQGYALESIDAVASTGWLGISPAIKDRLDRAWINLPWLVRPDGAYAAIGDSLGAPSRTQLARAPARDTATTHRAFPVGGYGIVRVPAARPELDGYLFLTAAWHGQSAAHKHRDALTFEWFDAGATILVDSGLYSTNRDERRDYVKSSRAHNTITIDGEDIDRGPPRAPELVATARLGELHAIAARVTHPEVSTTHQRVLLYAPGRWLLVHDQVTAQAPRAITAWFHLAPDARFERTPVGVGAAELAPLPRPFQIFDLTGQATVVAVRGQTKPELQGWVTVANGKLAAGDAIGLGQKGSAVRFDTLFLLDEAKGTPSLAASGGGSIDLCWRDGGGVHGARVAIRGEELALGPCEE